MIGSAKGYAQVQNDQTGNHLITSGRELLGAVGLVRQAIEPVVEPEFPHHQRFPNHLTIHPISLMNQKKMVHLKFQNHQKKIFHLQMKATEMMIFIYQPKNYSKK